MDAPASLVPVLDPAHPLLFIRRGEGVAGIGEALRLEFSGPDRIRDAAQAWRRIAAEAEELWPLLAAGARVHVCGDGSRMAPAVRAAFRDLAARHGRPDWLEAALAAGDYQEDVYTG
jgi:hypothetical protein